MGGFVAVHLLAGRPELVGAAMISGVDLGLSFGDGAGERPVARVDDNVGRRAGLHILAGTSPEALADEAHANAEAWGLSRYAARLSDRSLLMLTSNDGFAAESEALADAIEVAGGVRLTRAHFATDHSYSDCRIALQTAILRWLGQLAA